MRPKQPRRRPRVVTPLAAPIVDPELQLDFPLDEHEIRTLVREAQEEDQAFKDVTTIATVLSDRRARARPSAHARSASAILSMGGRGQRRPS